MGEPLSTYCIKKPGVILVCTGIAVFADVYIRHAFDLLGLVCHAAGH